MQCIVVKVADALRLSASAAAELSSLPIYALIYFDLYDDVYTGNKLEVELDHMTN